jgi:hypothetical protein
MMNRIFYRKEREGLRKGRKGINSALCGFFAPLAVNWQNCDFSDCLNCDFRMIKMILMISASTQSFPSFGGAGEVHKNQTNHPKITVQTMASVKQTSFSPDSKNKTTSVATGNISDNKPHYLIIPGRLNNEVMRFGEGRSCFTTEVVLSGKSGKNEVFIPLLPPLARICNPCLLFHKPARCVHVWAPHSKPAPAGKISKIILKSQFGQQVPNTQYQNTQY